MFKSKDFTKIASLKYNPKTYLDDIILPEKQTMAIYMKNNNFIPPKEWQYE